MAISLFISADPDPAAAGEVVTFGIQIFPAGDYSADWDFGDGGSAFGGVVQHIYMTPGTYTARVFVTDLNTGETASSQVTVRVLSGFIVVLNSDPNPSRVGQAVTFTADISPPGDYSADWDFSDGGHGSGGVVEHVYLMEGGYTVSVVVTALATGAQGTGSLFHQVLPGTLVFTLTAAPNPAKVGELVTLTVAFRDPGDYSADWDFGDGSAPAFGGVVQHAYGAVGSYTVRCTVTELTSGLQAQGSLIEQVTTGAPPPPPPEPPPSNATLAVSPNPAKVNQAVGFTAAVTGGKLPLRYLFSFGDGASKDATVKTAQHTYVKEGTFSATVKVTDAAGRQATSAPVSVVVSGTAPPPPAGGGDMTPLLILGAVALAAVALVALNPSKKVVAVASTRRER